MQQHSKDIVIVEDEIQVARTVGRAFADSGYGVRHFVRGRDLLHHLKQNVPDLCVIDLGLPDGDGLELVREIQARHDIAVIILTGRGDTTDRVVGLELGADDYIVKPFEPRELVARAKAVLRRFERKAGAEAEHAGKTARFRDWTFRPDTYALTSPQGETVTLSAAEAKLLRVLLDAPNRILSREQILEMVSGQDYSPFDRSIDVRISRLRNKIEEDSRDPQVIKTVYGAGYIFAASVEWTDG